MRPPCALSHTILVSLMLSLSACTPNDTTSDPINMSETSLDASLDACTEDKACEAADQSPSRDLAQDAPPTVDAPMDMDTSASCQGWSHQDIGAPSAAGMQRCQNQAHRIKGNGASIRGRQD